MLVQKLGANLMFGQKLKFFVRQLGSQVETGVYHTLCKYTSHCVFILTDAQKCIW